MTGVWLTVGALAAGTIAMKAAGPLAVGGHRLSPRLTSVISLVAPALLSSLTVYETFGAGGPGLRLDARVVGLAAAALGLWARLPMIAIVLLAALATAITRLLAV